MLLGGFFFASFAPLFSHAFFNKQGRDGPQFIKGSWAKKLGGHLDTVVQHLQEEAAEMKRQNGGQEFRPTGPCLQQILQDGMINKVRKGKPCGLECFTGV